MTGTELISEKISTTLRSWVKGPLRDYWWGFYGAKIRNPQLPARPRSFLFVCKGNICRSPFAEHLARRICQEGGRNGLHFGSMGLQVNRAEMPPDEAIAAGATFGVHLAEHRSRPLREKDVDAFDMIVTVEAGQNKLLARLFPNSDKKLFLLPLFDPAHMSTAGSFLRYNIPDPYGRSCAEFRDCYGRIKRCIEQMFHSLWSEEQEQI